MSHATRHLLGLGFLGLTLTALPLAGQVSAQATTGTGTSATGTGTNPTDPMVTTTDTGSTTRMTRDSAFNPSWLGLLGLAGLAGLLPKKAHPVVATTTTHRTGDSTVR